MNIIHTLGILVTCAVCSLDSTARCASHTAPAPPAPAEKLLPALSESFRHYLIGYTAASFETVVKLTQAQQAADTLASVEMQIQILESEPTDSLPADIKLYIQEAILIAKATRDEMKPIVAQTKKTDINTLGPSLERMKIKMRQLGKQYPAARDFIIDNALADQLIMKEMGFQEKFDRHMAIKLPEHNNDLVQAISAVFGILAKELRAIQQNT